MSNTMVAYRLAPYFSVDACGFYDKKERTKHQAEGDRVISMRALLSTSVGVCQCRI